MGAGGCQNREKGELKIQQKLPGKAFVKSKENKSFPAVNREAQ